MVLQFTRNQYFMVGLLLLLIGAQFRLIDSVVLTEKSARFVVEKFGPQPLMVVEPLMQVAAITPIAPGKIIRPPTWVGWFSLAGSMGMVRKVSTFTALRGQEQVMFTVVNRSRTRVDEQGRDQSCCWVISGRGPQVL